MRNTLRCTAVNFTVSVMLLLVAASIPPGCTAGIRLRTEAVSTKSAEGNYRLYLYGCHHGDDLENLALIVDEQSPYRFNLFVPETSFRIVSNLPFGRAIEQADVFVRCGIRTVAGTSLRRIVAPDGTAAGYELLPHYVPFEVGAEEAVLVNYSLKNGVITVYIRLDPSLERKDLFFRHPGQR